MDYAENEFTDGPSGRGVEIASGVGGGTSSDQCQRLRPFDRHWSSEARSRGGAVANHRHDRGRTDTVLERAFKSAQANKGPKRTRQVDAGRSLNGPRFPDGWRFEVLSKS